MCYSLRSRVVRTATATAATAATTATASASGEGSRGPVVDTAAVGSVTARRGTKRRHVDLVYEGEGDSVQQLSMVHSCDSDGGSGRWEPPHWHQQLTNIRSMRDKRDAPVDTEGAKALSDASGSPQAYRYHVLVSLMLSSQTKDHITAEAMRRLKQANLSVEWMLSTPEEEIARLIKPVGFWKRKAGYLKRTAAILSEQYGGDIPRNVQDLVSLPGVGPKMAHLVMDIGWNSVSGIGVDTHVQRITHRLGWVRGRNDPEITRKQLEEWLPRSLWSELNWLLVGFGQQICLPVRPHCNTCLNKDICPASTSTTKHVHKGRGGEQEDR